MATSSEVMESDPVNTLREECLQLKESIKTERAKYKDTSLREISSKLSDVSLVSPLLSMKTRKILKYQQKVVAFDWSPDRRHLISGGENGCAVIWDGFTGNKEVTINTNNGWILSCAYSPSTTLIACGGLSKRCSIYEIRDETISRSKKELVMHTKYITDCTFLGSDQQILTASADSKVGLWDMERSVPVQEFIGHHSEVMGIATYKPSPYSVFVSCGNDQCVCVWDIRTGKCTRKINDYSAEINAVQFFPNGEAFATAANDGTVSLYDMRADHEIMIYSKPTILLPAASLDFSKSGRVLFVGYDDHTLRSWDVLKGDQLSVWYDHEDRISHVQLSPDGTAIGTCSWDSTIRIWA